MKHFLLSLLILSFFLIDAGAQSTIGVSPNVIPLGDIERGDTKVIKFDAISSSKEVIVAKLEAVRESSDFFTSGVYRSYIGNYSEEDASRWVEFLLNPIELKPGSYEGTSIKNSGEVIFVLRVPRDAEPGYHSLRIMLYPITPNNKGLVGVKTISPLTIWFNVPGEAVRERLLYDISLKEHSNNAAYLDTVFQNTGDVTMLVRSGEMEVFDSDNNLVGVGIINGDYVKPGEFKTFRSIWQKNQSLEIGTYKVKTQVDYSNDVAEKTSFIELREIPPPKTGFIVEEKKTFVPIWLIVIIIITVIGIAYWWYKRD